MGNYRPISIISHLAKIFEKTVKTQIMNYFIQHNFFTDNQMAYINGRSTETALSFMTNTWLKNIDNGLFTCALMIDLSHCFNSVPHDKLLNKLSFMELKG